MLVRMLVPITGTYNGRSWPPVGGTVDLPETQAIKLCRAKKAVPVPAEVETTVSPAVDEETRSGPSECHEVEEPAPVETRAVREWATSEGLDVPARGRLPAAIVELYREAHGQS